MRELRFKDELSTGSREEEMMTEDQMIPCSDIDEIADAIRLEPINIVKLDREGHFYQWSLQEVVTSIRQFLRDLQLLED